MTKDTTTEKEKAAKRKQPAVVTIKVSPKRQKTEEEYQAPPTTTTTATVVVQEEPKKKQETKEEEQEQEQEEIPPLVSTATSLQHQGFPASAVEGQAAISNIVKRHKAKSHRTRSRIKKASKPLRSACAVVTEMRELLMANVVSEEEEEEEEAAAAEDEEEDGTASPVQRKKQTTTRHLKTMNNATMKKLSSQLSELEKNFRREVQFRQELVQSVDDLLEETCQEINDLYTRNAKYLSLLEHGTKLLSHNEEVGVIPPLKWMPSVQPHPTARASFSNVTSPFLVKQLGQGSIESEVNYTSNANVSLRENHSKTSAFASDPDHQLKEALGGIMERGGGGASSTEMRVSSANTDSSSSSTTEVLNSSSVIAHALGTYTGLDMSQAQSLARIHKTGPGGRPFTMTVEAESANGASSPPPPAQQQQQQLLPALNTSSASTTSITRSKHAVFQALQKKPRQIFNSLFRLHDHTTDMPREVPYDMALSVQWDAVSTNALYQTSYMPE
jgi:hypothetical protein